MFPCPFGDVLARQEGQAKGICLQIGILGRIGIDKPNTPKRKERRWFPLCTGNMRVLLHGEDKSPDLSEAICVLQFFLERLDNFGNIFSRINGEFDIVKEYRLDGRLTPRVQGLVHACKVQKRWRVLIS
jgi:hypothetical protein